MIFESSFKFLCYLVSSKLITSIEFTNEGGMGHSKILGESFSNKVSDADYTTIVGKIEEVFYDWFENDSIHPDFHLPPDFIKFNFKECKDGMLLIEIETVYKWDNSSELQFDKKYIKEYGGKMKGSDVRVAGTWGDLEVTSENKHLNDNVVYTIA